MTNENADPTIQPTNGGLADKASHNAMMARLRAKKNALDTQREAETSATVEDAEETANTETPATTDTPTTVESEATESMAKLTEKQATAELNRLWKQHDENLAKDRKENSDLDKTQQARLRKFLADAYPQAQELILPENRDVLNSLIRNRMMDTPKITESGLYVQIAALQIGKNDKDGVYKTPSRREERYGALYRIFADKGWTAANLESAIALAGGTSKIIEADKQARRKASGVVEKREAVIKEAYADDHGPTVKVHDAMKPDTGKWRLALVSVHAEGEVRIHSLVGKADDAATKRALEGYADSALAIRESIAANSSPTEQADNRAAA